MSISKKRPRNVPAIPYLEKLLGPLTLGKTMESIRLCEEMSQPVFAAQLGISRSHLNDIEKGRKPVSAVCAARYAKILGYSEPLFVQLAIQDQLARGGLSYVVNVQAKPAKRRAA